MTDRNYGYEYGSWMGEVVDVNDPDKSGRVKVRIFGQHDDKTNIPDKDLLWAVPKQDIKSAGFNKIGSAPVGVVKGSKVVGRYLDKDHQILMFDGVLAKAGDEVSGSTTNNTQQIDPKTNDTPPGSRVKTNKTNTRQDKNIKEEDSGKESPKPSNDDEAKDLIKDIAIIGAKFPNLGTIGSLDDISKSIFSQIKQIDPTNASGAIPSAMNGMSTIQDITNATSSLGNSERYGIIISNVLIKLRDTYSLETIINGINLGLSNGQYKLLVKEVANSLVTGIINLMIYDSKIIPVPDSVPVSTTNQESIIYDINSLFGFNIITIETEEIVEQLETYIETQPLSDMTLSTSEQVISDTLFKELKDMYYNITFQNYVNILNRYYMIFQNQNLSNVLGNNTNENNILSNISNILPNISSVVNSVLSKQLPNSVLNQNLITETLKKFSKNMAILDKKLQAHDSIHETDNNSKDTNLQDTLSKGLKIISPITGNIINGR